MFLCFMLVYACVSYLNIFYYNAIAAIAIELLRFQLSALRFQLCAFSFALSALRR